VIHDKEDSELSREKAVDRMKERIENDAKWPDGHPPPQKGMNMSDFRKALLQTAIPIVVLSLLSTLSYWIAAFVALWFIAAFIVLIALGRAIFSLVTGERGRAAGIFTGIAIGIISTSASCFANLSNIEL